MLREDHIKVFLLHVAVGWPNFCRIAIFSGSTLECFKADFWNSWVHLAMFQKFFLRLDLMCFTREHPSRNIFSSLALPFTGGLVTYLWRMCAAPVRDSSAACPS